MLRKHLYPLLAAALACLPTCAQAQAPADSATFLLHKFAQRIGKETNRLTRTAPARPPLRHRITPARTERVRA